MHRIQGGVRRRELDPQDISTGQIPTCRTHTFLISDFRLQGLLCWLNRDFLNLSITLLFRSWCRAGGSCRKQEDSHCSHLLHTSSPPMARQYALNKTEEESELVNYMLQLLSSVPKEGSASIYLVMVTLTDTTLHVTSMFPHMFHFVKKSLDKEDLFCLCLAVYGMP